MKFSDKDDVERGHLPKWLFMLCSSHCNGGWENGDVSDETQTEQVVRGCVAFDALPPREGRGVVCSALVSAYTTRTT